MWTVLTVFVACRLRSALKSKKLGISAYLETEASQTVRILIKFYTVYIKFIALSLA